MCVHVCVAYRMVVCVRRALAEQWSDVLQEAAGEKVLVNTAKIKKVRRVPPTTGMECSIGPIFARPTVGKACHGAGLKICVYGIEQVLKRREKSKEKSAKEWHVRDKCHVT